jgi:hypothetical protein
MAVFEPKDSFNDGNLAYSCTLLIPKTDKKLVKQIEDAIEAAKAAAIKAGKFTAAQAKLATFKYPMRDGDIEREANPDSRGKEYEGMYFINARNTNPVGCVDSKVQPIPESSREAYYSGWWINADVNFYGFSAKGSVGIACGLNNVMFVRSDERLDGRQNAVDAFAGMAVDSDDGEEPNFD